LTLGFYEKFPVNLHLVESFVSALASRQLQQRLIQVFYETNRKEFSFEEVANPTIPGCKVIFEFGFADAEGFSYIDQEEEKKVRYLLGKENLRTVDFLCGIRYYRQSGDKKSALRFDYYLIRTVFNRDMVEFQIHHERGPRYITPEDLSSLIFSKVNEASNKKALKRLNTIV